MPLTTNELVNTRPVKSILFLTAEMVFYQFPYFLTDLGNISYRCLPSDLTKSRSPFCLSCITTQTLLFLYEASLFCTETQSALIMNEMRSQAVYRISYVTYWAIPEVLFQHVWCKHCSDSQGVQVYYLFIIVWVLKNKNTQTITMYLVLHVVLLLGL